jgi:hypothetical protein
MTKKIIEKPFPPVDEVCYSLPSPDVGVEIWNRLLDDDTSTLSLTFGAVHECESLHELINELNENHKSQYCTVVRSVNTSRFTRAIFRMCLNISERARRLFTWINSPFGLIV